MWLRATVFGVGLGLALASTAAADGFIQRPAPDGTWARFEGVRVTSKPVGGETTLPETVVIRFVGTTEVDGEPCRWIEISTELMQENGRKFTEIQKLLIPVKYLTGNDDPLEHVKKAWRWNSVVPKENALTELKLDDVRTWRILRTWVRPYLREPLAGDRIEPATIECKLGEVECAGKAATDRWVEPVTGLVYESKFLLRLHPDSPLGVAAWEHEVKVSKDEPFGTTTTRLHLAEFGKDAKSVIPDAN